MKENGLNKIAELSQHHKYVQGKTSCPYIAYSRFSESYLLAQVWHTIHGTNSPRRRRMTARCASILSGARPMLAESSRNVPTS